MSAQSLVLRHGKREHRVCFATVATAPADEFLSESEKEQLWTSAKEAQRR